MASNNSVVKQVSEITDLFSIGSTVLFYIKEHTTVEDTIKILRAHNLHSIPVVSSSEEKQVMGVLDVLDLVSFVVDVAPEKLGKEKVKLAELERSGRVLALSEVKYLINESKRDPYVVIDAQSGGRLAFELLARGIHRVLLSDHTGKVLGNLSQSDLVNYIFEHKNYGDNKAVVTSTTAKDLVASGSAVVCHTGERVISILQRMKETGVSALAVLNHDGRLKGNFSASDLKGIYEVDSTVPPFKEHVEDFLEEHSPASLSPIVVRGDASLETVIATLVESKLHHIWVVDEDFKLVGRGSISLTDVLSYIYNYKL